VGALRITVVVAALASLALPGAAVADPVPGIGQAWPMCGTLPDDDGRYCVVSQKKNGVDIVRPPSGTYEEPYVDRIDDPGSPPGTIRFGVYHTNVDTATSTGDVPPETSTSSS
jgi:hypothetical protein